mmetsp:Transcript_33625/g.73794  ORF Transcript_33625/g.73794 Transcript_33625/m.73794 type:complete len:286 (-) Transcript_33625:702-1559(-)
MSNPLGRSEPPSSERAAAEPRWRRDSRGSSPRFGVPTSSRAGLAWTTLARLRCFSLVGAGAEADDGDDADDADADAAAAAAAADDDDDDGDDKEEDDDRGGRVDFDTDATDDGDLESDARDGGGGDAALTLKADGGDEAGCSRLGLEFSPPPRSEPSGHVWSKERLSTGVSALVLSVEQIMQERRHISCISARCVSHSPACTLASQSFARSRQVALDPIITRPGRSHAPQDCLQPACMKPGFTSHSPLLDHVRQFCCVSTHAVFGSGALVMSRGGHGGASLQWRW